MKYENTIEATIRNIVAVNPRLLKKRHTAKLIELVCEARSRQVSATSIARQASMIRTEKRLRIKPTKK